MGAFWRPLLALMLALAASGCASPPTPPTPVAARRAPPESSFEDRARAQEHAAAALDSLAEARSHLVRLDAEAGAEWIAHALERVRAAQALLPPEVVAIPTLRGGAFEATRGRDPLEVPASALGADTLQRLRPYRVSPVRALRVDLDALERRLAPAASASPSQSLAELLAAVDAAVRVERAAASHLAGDDADPAPPDAEPASSG